MAAPMAARAPLPRTCFCARSAPPSHPPAPRSHQPLVPITLNESQLIQAESYTLKRERAKRGERGREGRGGGKAEKSSWELRRARARQGALPLAMRAFISGTLPGQQKLPPPPCFSRSPTPLRKWVSWEPVLLIHVLKKNKKQKNNQRKKKSPRAKYTPAARRRSAPCRGGGGRACLWGAGPLSLSSKVSLFRSPPAFAALRATPRN